MKKRFTHIVILFAVLISFSACDSDDGVSSSALAGNYTLNYFMDKASGVTLYAGQTNTYEGISMAITGTLTLTADTFTMAMTVTTTVFGQTSEETTTESGNYTVNGNTMTVSSSEGDAPDNLTYSLSGNQLTLENDEVKIVFDKR